MSDVLMKPMSYEGSFNFDDGQQHGIKMPLAAEQLIASLLPGEKMGAATAFRLADLLIMSGDIGAGVRLIETGQQLLDAAQHTALRMQAAASGEDEVEYSAVNSRKNFHA